MAGEIRQPGKHEKTEGGKADGKPLRLFYSKVAVKLVGSSTWMEAR